jgi:hypothetical protein
MQFWDYTPAEINLFTERHNENRKQHIDDIIYLAWHTEAFARTKKLAKLKDLIGKGKKENKPQTVDQMLNTVKL